VIGDLDETRLVMRDGTSGAGERISKGSIRKTGITMQIKIKKD